MFYKKGGHYGRQVFRLDIDKKYHYKNVFSGWVDLVYDNIINLYQDLNIEVADLSVMKFRHRV